MAVIAVGVIGRRQSFHQCHATLWAGGWSSHALRRWPGARLASKPYRRIRRGRGRLMVAIIQLAITLARELEARCSICRLGGARHILRDFADRICVFWRGGLGALLYAACASTRRSQSTATTACIH